MGKVVRSYKASSLSQVNTAHYNEGDLFLTNRSVGIIMNGKMVTFNTSKPNLKEYVKKEEVEIMIDDKMKKVNIND